MALLSEKPEYNAKIHAASLMAPTGYMSHADWMLRLLTLGRPILEVSNEHQLNEAITAFIKIAF